MKYRHELEYRKPGLVALGVVACLLVITAILLRINLKATAKHASTAPISQPAPPFRPSSTPSTRPQPIISHLSPSSWTVTLDFTGGQQGNEGQSVTITIEGQHFLPQAQVCFDGIKAKTIFLSSERLKAILPATSGREYTIKVTVINKPFSDVSNAVDFNVHVHFLGG